MPDPTCPVCGSPWFEPNDDGALECCDCDTTVNSPTPSNPVPTPSHLVPDGAAEPPGDPVHVPRPGTPVGGAGGDGVALPAWGPGTKITDNPVPGRGQR